ncbi:hypothetical protein EON65_33400, partial [archaeon]
MLSQKHAAVLRLKESASKYKFCHTDPVSRFMSFWSNLLMENDRRDDGKFYKDVVLVLTGEPMADEEEERIEDNLVPKFNASKLESLFEESLGLLFESKTGIAKSVPFELPQIQQSSLRNSTRPNSLEAVASHPPFLKKGSGSGRGSELLTFTSSSKNSPRITDTDLHEEPEHLDKFPGRPRDRSKRPSATKSVTWSVAGGDQSPFTESTKVPGPRKPTLAVVIERLQNMGLYSESKLKYTYGLNRKERKEQQAEATRKRKEEEENRKLKRGDSRKDGGVLHVETLGDGSDIPV